MSLIEISLAANYARENSRASANGGKGSFSGNPEPNG